MSPSPGGWVTGRRQQVRNGNDRAPGLWPWARPTRPGCGSTSTSPSSVPPGPSRTPASTTASCGSSASTWLDVPPAHVVDRPGAAIIRLTVFVRNPRPGAGDVRRAKEAIELRMSDERGRPRGPMQTGKPMAWDDPTAHRPPHRGGSANEDEVRSSALRAQVHGRSHAGFTQAELAEPMGTTRSATVRMEGGAVRPALATLDKLASAGWRRAGRSGRREPFGQLLHRQAGARATPPSAGPADRTRGRVMGGLGAG
jgi:hypothetical protein